MEGRFCRYIDELEEETEDKLHLLHTTSAYDFVDICQGDTLDPVRCEVFKEDLLYLFYGRPAYRTAVSVDKRLKFNWPFSFIVAPERLDEIHAVYPFDTGAFALGLYEGFFHKKSKLEDFRLKGDISCAQKIVKNFYGSAENYFNGDANRELDIPRSHFEAQGVHALAEMPLSVQLGEGNFERDERSNSIEVQVQKNLSIKDCVIGLVAPSAWQLDADFIEAVNRWGIENRIFYYEITSVDEGRRWTSHLYEKVREFRDQLKALDQGQENDLG